MKSKFFVTAMAALAVAGTVGLLKSPARLGVSGSGSSAPFGESAQYAGAPREFNHGLTLGSAVFIVPRQVSVQGGRVVGWSRVGAAAHGHAHWVGRPRQEAGADALPIAVVGGLARREVAQRFLPPAAGTPSGSGVRGPGFSVVSHAIPSPLPLLFAQINSAPIDGSIRSFLDNVVQKILILPALALAVWSAWCFHDNKIRDALLSLVGAFLCATAVTIVKAIFGL
jgi:hypothetical protein